MCYFEQREADERDSHAVIGYLDAWEVTLKLLSYPVSCCDMPRFVLLQGSVA